MEDNESVDDYINDYDAHVDPKHFDNDHFEGVCVNGCVTFVSEGHVDGNPLFMADTSITAAASATTTSVSNPYQSCSPPAGRAVSALCLARVPSASPHRGHQARHAVGSAAGFTRTSSTATWTPSTPTTTTATTPTTSTFTIQSSPHAGHIVAARGLARVLTSSPPGGHQARHASGGACCATHTRGPTPGRCLSGT